jgi:hypothetical protein
MISNRAHHGWRRRPLPQFFDRALNGSTATAATDMGGDDSNSTSTNSLRSFYSTHEDDPDHVPGHRGATHNCSPWGVVMEAGRWKGGQWRACHHGEVKSRAWLECPQQANSPHLQKPGMSKTERMGQTPKRYAFVATLRIPVAHP